MIRALIADDEPPARDKLDRWLGEQTDIEVVSRVSDGMEAADAIEKLKPDIAFLDIQMPTLNGLEVAAQLEREVAPLLVFVTAFDEHAVRAFDLNAIDYLLKPYDKGRAAMEAYLAWEEALDDEGRSPHALLLESGGRG